MLTPNQLRDLVETMQPVLDELNTWITRDMVQRVVRRMSEYNKLELTGTDVWQARVYQEAGGHLENLQKEMQTYTRTSGEEIRAIFRQAAILSYAADAEIYEAAGVKVSEITQSNHIMRILQDTFDRTNGEIYNFTRTTAEESQKRLISVLDNAHMRVMTGAQSYSAATREAVDELVNTQAQVHYPTGHKDTLETAVFRAIRTGTAQACGNISIQTMIDNGWDIILVSAHLGARYGDGGENAGNHAWWQGKFYSRTGATPDLPLFDATGYGTGPGLCGWNCRHSFGPGDGKNNPYTQYDAEENKKAYDISQKQRSMESAIRRQKQRVLGLSEAIEAAKAIGDTSIVDQITPEYQAAALKLHNQNSAYHSYCTEHELKERGERLHIAKWNRSQAAKATAAAKAAKS